MRINSWQMCVLALAVVVCVGCTGCARHLQGRYVCTQDVDDRMIIIPHSSKRPSLDFRRDGTVYLDSVDLGMGQMQGRYTVQGADLRISLAGGLEVHSASIHGKTIDSDFHATRFKDVTAPATKDTTVTEMGGPEGSRTYTVKKGAPLVQRQDAEDVKLSFVKQ